MKTVLIICSAFLFVMLAGPFVTVGCIDFAAPTATNQICPLHELNGMMVALSDFQAALLSMYTPVLLFMVLASSVIVQRLQVATDSSKGVVGLRMLLYKLWLPLYLALKKGVVQPRLCG